MQLLGKAEGDIRVSDTTHSVKRVGWLIYHIKDGEPHLYGVLETEEKARAEVAVLKEYSAHKYEIHCVWFIGWAMAMPVSNDDRKGSRGEN